MNEGYELDADLYLPFRYQLTLKVVFLTAMFCPAIPMLLPFASAFMFASHRVDRHSRSARRESIISSVINHSLLIRHSRAARSSSCGGHPLTG